MNGPSILSVIDHGIQRYRGELYRKTAYRLSDGRTIAIYVQPGYLETGRIGNVVESIQKLHRIRLLEAGVPELQIDLAFYGRYCFSEVITENSTE